MRMRDGLELVVGEFGLLAYWLVYQIELVVASGSESLAAIKYHQIVVYLPESEL